MKTETYFNRYKKIYGVSYRYEFGWKCYCIEFDNLATARKWLNTEEYDFRTRELLSKSQVIKDWGRAVFDNRNVSL